jgi:CRISPR system Cascade subunit CasE
MYLSRLILNPRSRRVQKEIADPYQLHRSLMRAFPDGLEDGDERVLFRLDAHPRSDALSLLVQSLNAPDWSWLAEPGARGYLLPEELLPPQVTENLATKALNLEFTHGQRLAFRLRANPTVKRNGKRLGLLREEEQHAWLARKAQAGGFRIVTASVWEEGLMSGTIHRSQEESHRLRLLAVRFDGLLQVVEPARFQDTLQAGIGSGKGLGFGLLSLGPA